MFISEAMRPSFKGVVDENYWDTIERNQITEKILNLPLLYFEETFESDKQPYQDVNPT